MDFEPKYDFLKKEPAKLESTCKIAWPFVIRLHFPIFQKCSESREKFMGRRVGMHRSGFGGLESFRRPLQKLGKSQPYKEWPSVTTSKNAFQTLLFRSFRTFSLRENFLLKIHAWDRYHWKVELKLHPKLASFTFPVPLGRTKSSHELSGNRNHTQMQRNEFKSNCKLSGGLRGRN